MGEGKGQRGGPNGVGPKEEAGGGPPGRGGVDPSLLEGGSLEGLRGVWVGTMGRGHANDPPGWFVVPKRVGFMGIGLKGWPRGGHGVGPGE